MRGSRYTTQLRSKLLFVVVVVVVVAVVVVTIITIVVVAVVAISLGKEHVRLHVCAHPQEMRSRRAN